MYYRSQIIRVRDVKVVALLLVGHVCLSICLKQGQVWWPVKEVFCLPPNGLKGEHEFSRTLFFKTLVQFVLLFWNCKATLRMAQELRFSIGANIIIWLSVMNGKKKTLFFQSYLSTLTCITYQSCVYYTFRFYACVSGDSWWNNLCDYCNIYVHLRLSIQDCSQSQ